MKNKTLFLLLNLLLWWAGPRAAHALTNAFTFQGVLTTNDGRATGVYDLCLTLFDAAVGGTQQGSSVTLANVVVNDGLVSVLVDFGTGVFNGDPRWVEIGLRPGGTAGTFTNLPPRQQLTPTPYALYAGKAATLTGNSNQTFTGAVTFNPPSGAPFAVGSANKVANLNADLLDGLDSSAFWKLGGNSGTTPGTDLLGTTDNQALEFKVNNTRALRLEPNDTSPNMIGGHRNNAVSATVVGATISGGGSVSGANCVHANFATVSGGAFNTAAGEGSAIGGGINNIVEQNSRTGTISGGENNLIQTGSGRSTIGGGSQNIIQTNSPYATIGGGTSNSIKTNSQYTTIGGGLGNLIQANVQSATVSGGSLNGVGAASSAATIGGGSQNIIQANAWYAVIGGGNANIISDNAICAAIPGGYLNTAGGNFSFAAGRQAKANHTGSFVWGDSTLADIASTGNNQFIVRASGGVWFGTSSTPSFPAGSFLATSTGGYLSTAGMWVNSSDRERKANFSAVNGCEVLERLSAVPVQTWNSKEQDRSIRHIGATAQDFYAAFQVGEDDRHINTVDADGVALAAIQGLNQIVKEQAAKIESLEKRLADLERLMSSSAQKPIGVAK